MHDKSRHPEHDNPQPPDRSEAGGKEAEEHGPGNHRPAHASSQLHHGDVCCRDTFLTINGQTIDLAREPLTLEFAGFELRVSYSAGRERTPGETKVVQHGKFEIAISGPERGDPLTGRPPGRLFINGQHIEYEYTPATGRISHPSMFSGHNSLLDYARAYVSADPTLSDLSGPHRGHHH